MPISFWHAADVTSKVTLLIYENKKAANGTQQKDVLLFVIFLSLSICSYALQDFIYIQHSLLSKIKQFPVHCMSVWHLRVKCLGVKLKILFMYSTISENILI